MFMFFHVPTQACCEKKFEESFYRARMPVLLAKETGHNSRMKKSVKFQNQTLPAFYGP